MRTALLIAYIADVPHVKSGGVLVPIDQSEVEACKREFKEQIVAPLATGGPERFEVWTSSSGIVKRGKLRQVAEPEPTPEPEPEAKRRSRPLKQ